MTTYSKYRWLEGDVSVDDISIIGLKQLRFFLCDEFCTDERQYVEI